jgi:hypothetical protein
MGSGAKSYMRKGFLIYEEIQKFSPYMRRSLVIYDCTRSLWISLYIYESLYQCSIFTFTVSSLSTLVLNSRVPLLIDKPRYCHSHRVHRTATATFWRTFHHDGKISLGRWGWGGARLPSYTISTITYKVVMYAPAERADILTLFLLYPCMYTVVIPVQGFIYRALQIPQIYFEFFSQPKSLLVKNTRVNSSRPLLPASSLFFSPAECRLREPNSFSDNCSYKNI